MLIIETFKDGFFLSVRIMDNMPVTWCYQVEGQVQPVCERGFPLGCYITKGGKKKDTCVLHVSNENVCMY